MPFKLIIIAKRKSEQCNDTIVKEREGEREMAVILALW